MLTKLTKLVARNESVSEIPSVYQTAFEHEHRFAEHEHEHEHKDMPEQRSDGGIDSNSEEHFKD